VATTLRSVQVSPISGQAGWLMRNKLVDRLGPSSSGSTDYRLDVTLDDNITAFGLRGDQAATQEADPECALPAGELAHRDGCPRRNGSDAGVDIVSSNMLRSLPSKPR
jgi:LPS-assembly lipoprotein